MVPFFLLVALSSFSSASVDVRDRLTGVREAAFASASATFGRQIMDDDPIRGYLFIGNPSDGCSPMRAAPRRPDLPSVVLVARYGGCDFEEKVRNAQTANFSAVIVHNVDSDEVISMGGDDDLQLIPSVFIGQRDALLLKDRFVYNRNRRVFIVITSGDDELDINSYLLPFVIVVGISFVIMVSITVFKCFQDHRRSRRHRLPKSTLKKLPVVKFKVDQMTYETCCICIDDFVENEKLRILPCGHAYHSKCIDPWLLKNRRICPQCRKRVFDDGTAAPPLPDSDEEDNDTTPLLRNQNPIVTTARNNYGGTFSRTTLTTSPTTSASSSLPSSSWHHGRRGPRPSRHQVVEVLVEEDESEQVAPTNSINGYQQSVVVVHSLGNSQSDNSGEHVVDVEATPSSLLGAHGGRP